LKERNDAPYTNPFETRAVRLYLRDVKRWCKCRGGGATGRGALQRCCVVAAGYVRCESMEVLAA